MLVPLGAAMALLVAMTTKHLFADFIFQTSAIARGKAAEKGWFIPLALHAGMHAVITLAVVIVVQPTLWWLAVAEWVVHGLIDRLKVFVSREAHLDPSKEGFWWLLGMDQYLHQMTNIAIVYVFLVAA